MSKRSFAQAFAAAAEHSSELSASEVFQHDFSPLHLVQDSFSFPVQAVRSTKISHFANAVTLEKVIADTINARPFVNWYDVTINSLLLVSELSVRKRKGLSDSSILNKTLQFVFEILIEL